MVGTRTLHDNTAYGTLLFLAILLLVEVGYSLYTRIHRADRLGLICWWFWRFWRGNRRRDLWSDCISTTWTLGTSSLASGIALNTLERPWWRDGIRALLSRRSSIRLFS